jgi:hypothetical protein
MKVIYLYEKQRAPIKWKISIPRQLAISRLIAHETSKDPKYHHIQEKRKETNTKAKRYKSVY